MPLSESFNQEILDSLSEGLLGVNKAFRIIFINRAAEKITGRKREEVLGEMCKYICKSEFCWSECPITKALESGKNIYDFESKIQCANEQIIPVKLNAAVLKNGNGEPAGGVISFRDMSEIENIKSYLLKHTHFCGVVGQSNAMKDIFKLITEISNSDVTVLVQGETGTGKEMIANAIQATSVRRDESFVKVNCSVLPPHLLASELFGHAKGAFTDAVKERLGRFELAHQGTLFLDEVSEMSLQMQAQLLRVLQEGTFERLGESVTRKVDVRIIAATNTKILEAISSGKFREDLMYRLNVIPLVIPPLRDRVEDIPFLVKHFIPEIFPFVQKKYRSY